MSAITSSSRWSDEFLGSMRQVMDPPADDAVRELFEHGDVGAVNSLMRQLVTNDQIVPSQMHENIRRYLAETGGLPQWADASKISEAEDFFGRNGLLISMSLFFASLPSCYACAKGAQVLYLTARLETDPKRRLGETSQMILDAMATGGLGPDGDGVRDAQKVRLMHAAVRHLILNSGRWNADWGMPINQEDMGGTLMTFSCTPLRCLDKLGIAVAPDEAEAYIHAWNVIGHIMGVRPEMLPASFSEAEDLLDTIGHRHFERSEAGVEMTRALKEMVEETMPGTHFNGFPDTMIRFFVGDEVADILGVSKYDWTEKLIGPLGKLFGLVGDEEDRSRVLAKVSARFSRELTSSMAWVARGGHRAPFSVPEALRQQWNLNPYLES